MSVDMIIYLKSSKLITPIEWAKAIKEKGFDMELDTNFNIQTAYGFRPCKYRGEFAGFEYSNRKIEIREKKAVDLDDRDIAITLSTTSKFIELMTSVIAAGVLCSITDGILYDTEEGTYTKAQEAIAWSKEGEQLILEDLKRYP